MAFEEWWAKQTATATTSAANEPNEGWDMSEPKDQTEAAAGGSALTAELGNEITLYLRQLAPHQNKREGPTLLRDALAEIARLRQGDACARVCECTAYRAELRRLQRLIVAHVNAGNDDSAGDTFVALMEVAAEVPDA